MAAEWALILSVVALAPILLYALNRILYPPRVSFRVGGEQIGNPIPVTVAQRIPFAATTDAKHRMILGALRVKYDPHEVDLSKTRGAELATLPDPDYPLALQFSGARAVSAKNLQGFFWDHAARKSEFSVVLEADVQADEADLPLPLDMFPPRKARIRKVVKFRVYQETIPRTLQQTGVRLGPGESLHMEGLQAQEAIHAAAEKGEVQLNVYEGEKRSEG